MNLYVREGDGSVSEINAVPGQTILQALQSAGKQCFAPCGGNGTCGRCKVLVRDDAGVGYKLACETPATEGITVMLEEMGAMKVAGVSASLMTGELKSSEFGVAIDVGSTTMVFHLVELESKETVASIGRVNPQVVFGSDVIARINAASEPDGFAELCSCLSDSIEEACKELCESARIDTSRIRTIALVGNTTMEHFATGLDPQTIGVSPFTPLSLFGEVMPLHRHEVTGLPPAYVAPAVAGYVGGDITAGLLASSMMEREGIQLFIDIGTNGEMALGNNRRAVCCATAAGPAFEGASITLGMPAMPGAVSSVEAQDGSWAIETVDDAPAAGICGSGLLDAVSAFVKAGIVDETGYLLDEDEVADQWAPWIGEEAGQTVCYLDDSHNVYLTQSDIRKVQLAKSAIRAGIETMMSELEMSYDDIDEVALAGGFGMHLDPKSATGIGLIPPQLDGKVKAYGNTAGTGATLCLFDEGRLKVEEIASSVEYLELSTDKRFNEFYIDYMGFEED